ncbi:MAG: hypothetical protein GVY16_10910 [Planctomycetes bacterium]|jgi:hypothetical protein|nr:hypothetical protein [Phycisphaerae bacterium]NBB96232.1 hypothetical protein [Planctomycetota bacterium]
MSMVDWMKEKSGDDSMKYVLAGGLVLVIGLALFSTITEYTGGPEDVEVEPRHFWDVEKQQEYTLTPEEMKERQYGRMDMQMGQMAYSPLTGENTGVPMTKCPNCKNYFVAQGWANPDQGYDPHAPVVCPHCDTDRDEWFRERRRNR